MADTLSQDYRFRIWLQSWSFCVPVSVLKPGFLAWENWKTLRTAKPVVFKTECPREPPENLIKHRLQGSPKSF